MSSLKFINYLYSFKALILFYWSLTSDAFGLITKLQLADAIAQSWTDDNYYCTLSDGTRVQSKIMNFCGERSGSDPLVVAGIVMVSLHCACALCVLLYSLYKSPEYGSINYYAHMVMTKRQRYFKYLRWSMYALLFVIILLYVIGMFVMYSINGVFSGSFCVDLLSTMVVAGIAVAELKTTNEIHFQYEVQDEQKPIYLKIEKKMKCCNIWRKQYPFITAEDVFERMEEAISLYAISNNDVLLRNILMTSTHQEIQRVMQYYRYVYGQTTVTKPVLDNDAETTTLNVQTTR